MCSETDFTQEKVNFHATSGIPNSSSYCWCPTDDHLQEAGPFGSSFARGRPLILTTTKRAWKMLSCYLVTLSDSHCPDHCVRCFNHLCCIFKVAARWAVTAAHCFFRNGQQEIFEKDMTFVIGVHDRRVINNKLRWQKLTLIVNLEEEIFVEDKSMILLYTNMHHQRWAQHRQ